MLKCSKRADDVGDMVRARLKIMTQDQPSSWVSAGVNTTPQMTCFRGAKCAQNGYREK